MARLRWVGEAPEHGVHRRETPSSQLLDTQVHVVVLQRVHLPILEQQPDDSSQHGRCVHPSLVKVAIHQGFRVGHDQLAEGLGVREEAD